MRAQIQPGVCHGPENRIQDGHAIIPLEGLLHINKLKDSNQRRMLQRPQKRVRTGTKCLVSKLSLIKSVVLSLDEVAVSRFYASKPRYT